MNEDASRQSQSESAALLEEKSAKAKPSLEAAKSRVTNLSQAKGRAGPEKPAEPTSSSNSNAVVNIGPEEEEPVRPVIGSDQAALFLDSVGKIVAAQPRCAAFFGRQPEELNGLNFKTLIRSGFDQEITKLVAKGQPSGQLSFDVLALGKDGSEFSTRVVFKFLPENPVFCWTVFVQAPGASSSAVSDKKSMNTQRDSELFAAATETVTQTETVQPETGAKPPTQAAPLSPDRLAAKLEAARAECERLARVKFETETAANKRLHQVQSEYGKRIEQLEQDLVAERHTNGDLSKKIESLEKSLEEQTKGMRRIKQQLSEPAATLEKASTEFQDLQGRHQALESEAAGLRQELKQLQGKLEGSQTSERQTQTRTTELAAQLDRSSAELRNFHSKVEENEAARKQLTADLDKERGANKLSRQKAEELNAQLQKSLHAAEQAEARAKKSATQSDDWEKKAADLEKTVEELARSHAAQQNVGSQSAERLEKLELQLKRANDELAAGRADAKKQDSARQRLEGENRDLSEANAKAKADLEKERGTNKTARQEAEELQAQLRKVQQAAEQAEARARESAARCGDWERKAAEREKTIDQLTRTQAAEQSAGAQSAQRIEKLEQQLKLASGELAARRTEIEKQNSTHQRLETEIRSLREANAQTTTDLKKTVEELVRTQAAEQKVGTQSAQCIEKLEQQLKLASGELAASRTEVEKQNSTHQRLETENRSLKEANAQTTADLKKTVDQLTRTQAAEQSAGTQSAQCIEKLEQQLKLASGELAARRTEIEKQNSTHQRLETENCSLKAANARTTADLKKTVDQLTRTQAAEQNAGAQSAQRIKELEQQLKLASGELAARRAEIEKQNSTHQRLETENRSLREANAQTTADLKRTIDQLTRTQAAEQNAGTQSAQRIEKLEQQLKLASGELAARRTEVEKQNSTHQRLETENRSLKEANAQTTADLKKTADELARIQAAEQSAGAQSAQCIEKLEQQLKLASGELVARRTEIEKQNSTHQRLETENRSLKEANAQTTADLKKTVEQLARTQAAEQSASAQSAQRIEKLEQQLKLASGELATRRTEIEKQNSTHERLETENRSLKEANAQTTADLKKTIDELARTQAAEQSAGAQSAQRIQELEQQLKKSQSAAEQAEARVRESAAECGDWKKKAADLKKTIDVLTQNQAALEGTSARSAERIKELEQQLKALGADLAAGKIEAEKQNSARQRLETENRKATEANAKGKADLEKEREAHKLARQKAQELNAELKNSQRSAEQAEARLRKSAAECSDWEKKAAELNKANSCLEKESDEQHRQNELLTKAKRQLEQQSVENKAEISKMQAALERGELQRKKLEDEVLRLREFEIKAQRGQSLVMDSLRQGLRQQVEDLRQSACGLLEIQLPDKQKRMAEAILRHALFLQVFLSASGKDTSETFPS